MVTRPWHGVCAMALGNKSLAPAVSLEACASMKGGNELRLNARLKWIVAGPWRSGQEAERNKEANTIRVCLTISITDIVNSRRTAAPNAARDRACLAPRGWRTTSPALPIPVLSLAFFTIAAALRRGLPAFSTFLRVSVQGSSSHLVVLVSRTPATQRYTRPITLRSVELDGPPPAHKFLTSSADLRHTGVPVSAATAPKRGYRRLRRCDDDRFPLYLGTRLHQGT